VTFPTVSAAVAAAIEAQRALATADWSEGSALKVRIAVHVGSAHRRGDDWFGLSLSRCARLVDAANGGQVVLGGAAPELLSESPVDEVGLIDLGRVVLRDLAGRSTCGRWRRRGWRSGSRCCVMPERCLEASQFELRSGFGRLPSRPCQRHHTAQRPIGSRRRANLGSCSRSRDGSVPRARSRADCRPKTAASWLIAVR
jgi:hypothetical protein